MILWRLWGASTKLHPMRSFPSSYVCPYVPETLLPYSLIIFVLPPDQGQPPGPWGEKSGLSLCVCLGSEHLTAWLN